MQHGMFHEIRIDCGKEFYLMLGMQDMFQHLRNRTDVQCFRQTQSKKVIFLRSIYQIINSNLFLLCYDFLFQLMPKAFLKRFTV